MKRQTCLMTRRPKTLFAVMGKNPFLVELTLQGDVLRKMPLVGWSNPEGVAVMGNGLLAITDERSHLLSIVKVDADTRELNIASFPKYDLGPSKKTRIKPSKRSFGMHATSNCCWVKSVHRCCSAGKSDGSPILQGDKQKAVQR